MGNIAVIIISDQTVQNVQFIKEIGTFDEYLFISTQAMEKKGCSEWIINTLHLDNNLVKKLIVEEFAPESIEQKLQEIYKASGEEYFVNITGGTKLMSIAVNDFFKSKTNATIYYLTGRNNQVINLTKNQKSSLQCKITLEEYLTSYGIVIKSGSQNKPNYPFEIAKSFYQEFLQAKPENIQLLQELRNHIQIKDRKSTEFEVKNFENLNELLEAISFEHKGKISRKDAEYLTGKWLEEYVFHQIKLKLKFTEDFIRVGLYLQKEGIYKTENDFDVMFIYENELYIIECKTSHKIEKKNKLNEYIYKLDALQKEFGLFAKYFIFTLGDLPSDKNQQEQVKDRLKFHKITLLTKKDFAIESTLSFDDWLEKF